MCVGMHACPRGSCFRCHTPVTLRDKIGCRLCGSWIHWRCLNLPVGLFPSRLAEGVAEGARLGDTRRHDYQCPRCNFTTIMGRCPSPASLRDNYLMLLDTQVTLDEFHYDSKSTADGNRDVLNKISRWGTGMGIPTMLPADPVELRKMPLDHRQLSWYAVDQTTTLFGLKRASKWSTMKNHRSVVYNLCARMGVAEDDIPTNATAFTHRMHGLLQRLGDDPEQHEVFTTQCLEDLVRLMRADYGRARGAAKLELAQANFALHAYTQAGLRANELFTQQLGTLRHSFVFGEAAKRQRIMPHLKLRTGCQTKENRFAATDVWCAYETKHAPLRTGFWAQIVVAELTVAGRGSDDQFVFEHPDGRPWTMAQFWDKHIGRRLAQLKSERLGGLERADLTKFGTNTFRRTWNTLAGQHPDPVSEDLRNRQARWRQHGASRVLGRMVSLYFAPRPQELLLATYWL